MYVSGLKNATEIKGVAVSMRSLLQKPVFLSLWEYLGHIAPFFSIKFKAFRKLKSQKIKHSYFKWVTKGELQRVIKITNQLHKTIKSIHLYCIYIMFSYIICLQIKRMRKKK